MPSVRLTDCTPWLATAWLEIHEEYTRDRPDHELLITCTVRSREEQLVLYRQGRWRNSEGVWVADDMGESAIMTECDGIKTPSRHNRKPAEAIDFAVVIVGKVSWDPREYEQVGRLAEMRNLIWGGRAPRPDYAHVELPN